MGLFYSFINDLISNNEMNERGQNPIKKPCGQAGCCSLHPQLKQKISDSRLTFLNNTAQTNNIELSMNNSNKSQTTSSMKRNQRRTRSQKTKKSSSSHYALLSNDEERLLEYVLDAYITYKGSQDLMAKSLSQKLNTDITKMKILCQTLCQLIEVKKQ